MNPFETANVPEIIRLLIATYGVSVAWGGWQQARADQKHAARSPGSKMAERAVRARRLIRMRGAARRHLGYLAILGFLAVNALTAAMTPGGSGIETPLTISSNVMQIVVSLIVTRLAEMDTHDRLALLSVRDTVGEGRP